MTNNLCSHHAPHDESGAGGNAFLANDVDAGSDGFLLRRNHHARRGGSTPRDGYLRWMLLIAVISLSVCGGCREEVVVPDLSTNSETDRHDDTMFRYAVENLNRLPEFGPHEILGQIVERLNQWERSDPAVAPWEPDPMLATLPATVQSPRLLQKLSSRRYDPSYDGVSLREAVILRDIARHVDQQAPEHASDVQRALRLFQWTVDNVHLDDDPSDGQSPLAQMPWHTVVFGHGRAVDRAWIFTLLARQQGLDVVLLAMPGQENSPSPTVWIAALLSDGQLYLFDPRLGLPVPGPEGQGVATLAQVAADDSLLRQLDTEGNPYPVAASQLSRVSVMLSADAPALSYRMKRIENGLVGKHRVVLTSDPSALASRIRGLPNVGRVQLWAWPYQAVKEFYGDDSPSRLAVERQMAVFGRFLQWRVNPLWSARLRHLAGEFETRGVEQSVQSDGESAPAGQQGAKAGYLQARAMISQLPSEEKDFPKEYEKHRKQIEALRARAIVIKQLATYWLGMINLEEREFQVAIKYFKVAETTETAQQNWPEGWGKSGARFSSARAYAEAGQTAKAIELYRSIQSDARAGCLLRARRLADDESN